MYWFTIAQGSATLCAMLPWSPKPTEYPGFLKLRFVSACGDRESVGDIGDNREGNICDEIDLDDHSDLDDHIDLNDHIDLDDHSDLDISSRS